MGLWGCVSFSNFVPSYSSSSINASIYRPLLSLAQESSFLRERIGLAPSFVCRGFMFHDCEAEREAEPECEAEVESSSAPARVPRQASDPVVAEVRLSFWRTLAESVIYTVQQTILREKATVWAQQAAIKYGD